MFYNGLQLYLVADLKYKTLNLDKMNLEEQNLNEPQKLQLNISAVSSRLSSADQEELQKCKDSPVYFYNKYVRKEGQKELTESEYEDFIKQVEYQRNMPLKLRKHYKDKPLLPSECYEKLPDFLKNGC
jgi:vancomycin resistance protein YoaR